MPIYSASTPPPTSRGVHRRTRRSLGREAAPVLAHLKSSSSASNNIPLSARRYSPNAKVSRRRPLQCRKRSNASVTRRAKSGPAKVVRSRGMVALTTRVAASPRCDLSSPRNGSEAISTSPGQAPLRDRVPQVARQFNREDRVFLLAWVGVSAGIRFRRARGRRGPSARGLLGRRSVQFLSRDFADAPDPPVPPAGRHSVRVPVSARARHWPDNPCLFHPSAPEAQ